MHGDAVVERRRLGGGLDLFLVDERVERPRARRNDGDGFDDVPECRPPIFDDADGTRLALAQAAVLRFKTIADPIS
jgi:hypothetical protein